MIVEKEITKDIIKQIEVELSDTIEVGIKEQPKRFAYTIAFIKFLETLKEYGIEENINILDNDIREKIINEFTNYLDK